MRRRAQGCASLQQMRRCWFFIAAGFLSACGTLLSVTDDDGPPPVAVGDPDASEAGDREAGGDGGASPKEDASADASVDAEPPRPIAFVSSRLVAGDKGAGAMSALCQSLATLARLPGTYAALIRTAAAPTPVQALKSQTWYRPDGQLLFAGSMTAPITFFLTEKQTPLSGSATVWTGGTISQKNCDDWSDGDAQAEHGSPNKLDGKWLSYGSSTCSIPLPVYCFEL